jgi:hypothetical protein
MKKVQKIWLIVFILMFTVPEVLFSPIILSVLSLFKINLSPIMFFFVDKNFFTVNQNYALLILFIETVGLTGLLFFNIKFNKNKYKKIISIYISSAVMFLICYLFLGYIVSNMSLSI